MSTADFVSQRKTYVVEHLDPELGPWSTLEYAAIASESADAGALFCLSSVSRNLDLPEVLRHNDNFKVESRSVEELYAQHETKICLLDPAASLELNPEDGDKFDVFLFGGILDRTSELRRKGFQGRHLGPVQMTTDTAVRVTKLVAQERKSLGSIPYIDHPEIQIDDHESIEMPFRYVRGLSGEPIMPKGMLDLIKNDSDKSFEDAL